MPRLTGRPSRTLIARLAADRGGVALLEFALAFPVLLGAGAWGIEVSNLALMNLRVSQYALNLADTVSRVGVQAGGGVSQLREADVNDSFQGVRLEGRAIGLGENGRVVLSSLENKRQSYDSAPQQRIHWQRCFGRKAGAGYDSSYGTTTVAAGSTAAKENQGTAMPDGMGPAGRKVKAPADTAVMFVEVNYLYKPVFGSMFVAPRIIHHTASLVVRDNRDLTQIHNPQPAATASTCDRYTA